MLKLEVTSNFCDRLGQRLMLIVVSLKRIVISSRKRNIESHNLLLDRSDLLTT
jgi:hypothetical protein